MEWWSCTGFTQVGRGQARCSFQPCSFASCFSTLSLCTMLPHVVPLYYVPLHCSPVSCPLHYIPYVLLLCIIPCIIFFYAPCPLSYISLYHVLTCYIPFHCSMFPCPVFFCIIFPCTMFPLPSQCSPVSWLGSMFLGDMFLGDMLDSVYCCTIHIWNSVWLLALSGSNLVTPFSNCCHVLTWGPPWNLVLICTLLLCWHMALWWPVRDLYSSGRVRDLDGIIT